MPGPMNIAQVGIDIGIDTHPFQKDLDKTSRKFNRTLNSMQSRIKTFTTNLTRMLHVAMIGFGGFVLAAAGAVSAFVNLENAQVELKKRMDVT